MSWNTIKIDPADRDFSVYIRLKARKCAKCGRQGTGNDSIFGLQASHFHSRRKWTTRFDEENVDVLCIGCHRYFTENKDMYKKWKQTELGQKKYDLLELRANTTGKRDFPMARLVWRIVLKEYKEKLFQLK